MMKISTVQNNSYANVVKQFDTYLKKEGLSLEFAFEPKYKDEDCIIPPYYYVNLLKDDKRINVKGIKMNLFGYGQKSRKEALKNLINKISGYKLRNGRKVIDAFCPSGTSPKKPRKPLVIEMMEEE